MAGQDFKAKIPNCSMLKALVRIIDVQKCLKGLALLLQTLDLTNYSVKFLLSF